jgi:hypothetical protein
MEKEYVEEWEVEPKEVVTAGNEWNWRVTE